jgi:hypothetical protein
MARAAKSSPRKGLKPSLPNRPGEAATIIHWAGTRLTAHETIMKLTDEFRQNADEWRQIEKIAATDDHRRRIAAIADTWLAWAERRERMLSEDRKTGKLRRRGWMDKLSPGEVGLAEKRRGP